jgi:hypothetical protein
MYPKSFLVILAMLFVLTACFGGSSGGGSSSTTLELTSGISSLSNGIAAAGSGLQSSKMTLTPMDASLCDAHGMPQNPSPSSGNMSQTDAKYPFIHTYCAMTINDGDTIRGGFALIEGLICSLEKGGIQFIGLTQSITADFSDTDCWPNGAPGGPGDPSSAVISAVGSAPASFNSHFEKGVIFSVADMGLTFKFAANIDTNQIEFIAHESWTSGDNTGNTGVMAGALNKNTGVIQFEKRDERIRTGCVDDSCGWNRHTRLYAVLEMDLGEPTDLSSISYGYADVAANDPTNLTTSSGIIITSSGILASGIKSRLFQASASIGTLGSWSETNDPTTTGCMDSNGHDTAECSISNLGIDKFSIDTKFALVSGQTSPTDWLTAFNGFSFLTTDLDVD